MSEANLNKPDLRKIKPDLVACVLCTKIHLRRRGWVHKANPVCQACDDTINKQANEVQDTVDFQVKGF